MKGREIQPKGKAGRCTWQCAIKNTAIKKGADEGSLCYFWVLRWYRLTIANVHRYFETKTHFSDFWFGPHDVVLLMTLLTLPIVLAQSGLNMRTITKAG